MFLHNFLFLISCFVFRGNLKQLIRNLNSQKNHIKKHGIVVDGKKYSVKFTGILQILIDNSVCCYGLSIFISVVLVVNSH